MLFAWVLWRLGRHAKPLAWLTGMYLLLSGVARYLVEFYRINPKLYWGMSNAQVAALLSALVGLGIMLAVRKKAPVGGPALEVVAAPS